MAIPGKPILPLEDFEKYIRHAVTIVRDLGSFYESLKDLSARDLLVGSIFPEKLIFENGKYRTARVNEAVRLICLIHKSLESKKADKKNVNFSSSALRRGRDSNPRYAFTYTHFPGVLVRPL